MVGLVWLWEASHAGDACGNHGEVSVLGEKMERLELGLGAPRLVLLLWTAAASCWRQPEEGGPGPGAGARPRCEKHGGGRAASHVATADDDFAKHPLPAISSFLNSK